MENETENTPLTSSEPNQPSQEPTLPVAEKSQQDTLKKDSKIPKIIIYFPTLLILLALGAFGFWFYQNRLAEKPSPEPIPTATPTPSLVTDASPEPVVGSAAEWQTYNDKEYGISFEYPTSWSILITDRAADPLYLLKKSIYFIKKLDGDSFFSPSIFAIKLYIDKEENVDLSESFKTFYSEDNQHLLDQIEKSSEDGHVKLEEITLDNKKAIKYDNPLGMMYGDTYITWVSEKRAVFMGSIGFSSFPTNPFEELGLPPYYDNPIIARIISSFKISPL
jgi:hypothetical protein